MSNQIIEFCIIYYLWIIYYNKSILYYLILQQENVFFNPTPEVRKRRLKKYTVPLEHQGLWESEKLWYDVTQAINRDDQIAATEAKTQLEEAQRERAKERKLKGQEWVPKHFVQVLYINKIK